MRAMAPSSPAPPANGSRLLRTAGHLVALALRTVPRRFRFRAAVVVARWLEPLIARTNAWETRRRLGTDTLREASLELVLMMLTRHGTEFDPIQHIEGAEHVSETGGATVVLSAHTMLSALVMRYFADRGSRLFVIAADPDLRIPGTRLPASVLLPSPMLLVQVRRLFRERQTVAAMIDRGDPERRNAIYHTSTGPMRISDALLRLALHHHARVLFLATRMDATSQIVMRFAAPSPQSTTVPEILGDFVRFFDESQSLACSESRVA
jgi:hypothetical protein